jgi:hypothetical protein
MVRNIYLPLITACLFVCGSPVRARTFVNLRAGGRILLGPRKDFLNAREAVYAKAGWEKREEESGRAEEANKQAEEAVKREAAEGQDKPKSFGEINVAPIRDIVPRLYNMYRSGALTLADDFKVTVAFKIDPDGSIPKESMHLVRSSGSEVVDESALEILWRLGESHIFVPLSTLSSDIIELDVNDSQARLSITCFAATPDEASTKATSISFMLKVVAATQKNKNPAVAELLSLLTLKADNKRIDAIWTVSKAAVSEMMKMMVGKSATTSH